MSGSASTKFQDHYAILNVDPKSDSESIQAAYTKLAERYSPDNFDTGDPEKFDQINLAFEVLSDPTLRKGFDQLKGVNQNDGPSKFSGEAFFDALKQATELRAAVLCILYDRRRTQPFKPSISIRHLEHMLKVTTEELNFALWYLKQRSLVVNDDKSSLQITVDGMDYLEKNQPSAKAVLSFMKDDAVTEKAADAPAVREPVLSVLNRVLAR
ncbi:MAG: DnaJ domain-containing protein [Acidobacteriia bacterium]|nr:DnaJ domain-containing protein [Terriglobia bacterium]